MSLEPVGGVTVTEDSGFRELAFGGPYKPLSASSRKLSVFGGFFKLPCSQPYCPHYPGVTHPVCLVFPSCLCVEVAQLSSGPLTVFLK